MKKLRRSRSDRMLFGVCGGVAEYFEIDPTLVRLGAVGLTLFARVGMPIVYLALAVVMPVDAGEEALQIEASAPVEESGEDLPEA